MDQRYARLFELAGPFLDTRENDVHTRIAFAFAQQLLETEPGDETVVLPAIILHDVGWKEVPEDLHLTAFGPGKNDPKINRIHEVEGARIARGILLEEGYAPRITEEICEIIEGHDSRRVPVSLNDAIVKDADRLWRYSPEALVIDPRRFHVDPARHAAWLGRRIDDWFSTGTAKKLARQEQLRRVQEYGPPNA
jgi:hypothetical protein